MSTIIIILLAVIAFIALLVICREAGFNRFAYGWLFFLLALGCLMIALAESHKAKTQCAAQVTMKGGAA